MNGEELRKWFSKYDRLQWEHERLYEALTRLPYGAEEEVSLRKKFIANRERLREHLFSRIGLTLLLPESQHGRIDELLTNDWQATAQLAADSRGERVEVSLTVGEFQFLLATAEPSEHEEEFANDEPIVEGSKLVRLARELNEALKEGDHSPEELQEIRDGLKKLRDVLNRSEDSDE